MPRIAKLNVALLILASALGGCAPKLSRTPLIVKNGTYEPFASMDEADQRTSMEIFYATSREPKTPNKLGPTYGLGRSEVVRLGVATVQLGNDNRTWEELRESSTAGTRAKVKITKIEEIGSLPSTTLTEHPIEQGRTYDDTNRDNEVWTNAEQWADLIDERLAKSDRKQAYVYIHGATTNFLNPIREMSTFAHFMGRDGAHIAFAWPVGSTVFGYFRAGDRARSNTRALRELLVFLAQETDVETIHVLAYSAGGNVLGGALHQLRLLYDDVPGSELPSVTKLSSVTLSGSDEDVPIWWQYWMDEADLCAEQVTAYVSGLDLTMSLAWVANMGRRTVGGIATARAPGDEAAVERGDLSRINIVDVTRAQLNAGAGTWAHSYWKDNPWVNSDVILQWQYGLQPAERGLVHPESPENATWWVFPKSHAKDMAEFELPPP